MALGTTYPLLASFAVANGSTLTGLAAEANQAATYLGLREACWCVEQGVPRQIVADPYGYLATLEAMLERVQLDRAEREALWQKLVPAGSSFLDTIVEAAWAVHFVDKPVPVRLEVPFDPKDRNSKNADHVVTLASEEIWLDVKSIHPQAEVLESSDDPNASPYALMAPDAVADLIGVRAKSKYDSKFRAAVTKGLLGTAGVGLLLSILKWEQSIPLLLVASPTPPARLFDQCPNLLLVWVHTLVKASGSDVLRPVDVVRWAKP